MDVVQIVIRIMKWPSVASVASEMMSERQKAVMMATTWL